MASADRPAQAERRSRLAPALVGATALFGLLLLLSAVHLRDARRDLNLVRSDLQASRQAVAARDDTHANTLLDHADGRLRSARRAALSFPLGVLKPVPLVGSPAKGIGDAVAAGREGVAAGRSVVRAAASFPTRAEGGVNGSDLSRFASAATVSESALADAQAHVTRAAARLRGAEGAALPQISGQAKGLAAELHQAAGQLDAARRGMALLADLTSPRTDARLLVLSQDSLELRPTGGYIGSYGVLHFDHGKVSLDGYQDSQALPPPSPPLTPPADLAPALPRFWGLSNANWWPDFATSARTSADLYARQGGGRVDGVLALTQYATARLVGAVGPLQVPGYAKPVTEDGFDQRVVYEVELKRPLDEPRKKFLTSLADTLFDRVFHLPGDRLPAVTSAIDRSVAAGDVQLWFADAAREAKLHGTVISGGLPPRGGDFVMLVDANLAASKANLSVVKDASYHVSRQGDGSLRARLDLTVADKDPRSIPLNPSYEALLRLYVPAGARLLGNQKDQGDDGPAPDGPYHVFSQLLDVAPESSQHVRFDYVLPASVAKGGDYRLTWLRQVGTPRDTFTVLSGARSLEVPATERALRMHRSLNGNPVADWLRRRWIVRKLGLL